MILIVNDVKKICTFLFKLLIYRFIFFKQDFCKSIDICVMVWYQLLYRGKKYKNNMNSCDTILEFFNIECHFNESCCIGCGNSFLFWWGCAVWGMC